MLAKILMDDPIANANEIRQSLESYLQFCEWGRFEGDARAVSFHNPARQLIHRFFFF